METMRQEDRERLMETEIDTDPEAGEPAPESYSEPGPGAEPESEVYPEPGPAAEPAPGTYPEPEPAAGTPARRRYQILSGNALKMIALITMIIDHIGAVILEMGIVDGYNTGRLRISYEAALFWWYADSLVRAVGRIAFPIYCFLITEGFTHTHNAKKYALRLGVFALLSEIPFDLAFYHSWFYTGHQNVFFTLLLGLLAIMSIDYFEKRSSGRWTGLAAAFCFVMLGDALRTDYGAFGVFFIVALYAFRGCGWLRTLTGCLLVAWETPAPLAFIPIQMYNGKKGKGKQGLKFFFYAVYPLHLLLLYGICTAFFW